ncbi:MAG TPA: FkbM family methyltransferase [Candidatus Bathyarchaeia archaeon]
MKDFRFLFEKYALGQHRRPEWQIQKFLSKFHGKIAFDIGAYHGQYAKLFSKRFDQVYAFEPDREAAEFLSSLRLSNVLIYQMALSDRNGDELLYRYDGLFCPGIMETFELNMNTEKGDGQYNGVNPVKVRATTYDSFAPHLPVDLVKIDVEGAEFKVLEGMKQAFLNRQVRRIIVELHNMDREKELYFRLTNYGFNPYWIDSSHCFGSLDPW